MVILFLEIPFLLSNFERFDITTHVKKIFTHANRLLIGNWFGIFFLNKLDILHFYSITRLTFKRKIFIFKRWDTFKSCFLFIINNFYFVILPFKKKIQLKNKILVSFGLIFNLFYSNRKHLLKKRYILLFILTLDAKIHILYQTFINRFKMKIFFF